MKVARKNKKGIPQEGIPPDKKFWHNLNLEDVYQKLQTDLNGISPEESEKRLEKYGKNSLPAPEPPTLLMVIIHQFMSPLIYILLFAGTFAVIIGDYKDAVFIFGVVCLNALIGTIQEWKAEQKSHAMQSLLKINAKVRRSKHIYTIPADELVPGDIVMIESGNKVPADLRLLQTNNLTIDESFLTGESLPTEKKLVVLDKEVPVSDRSNMAFAGSTVITGRGIGVVVETALCTEVGSIAGSLVKAESAKPPLVIRMDRFATQICTTVLTFAAILGIFTFLHGLSFYEVFFLMIAMSVSAIPEGLPVAMTVALSIATSRMLKRNVLVRKLMAVESLGSCTTIASDKTGTLTVNQQTLKKLIFPDGAIIDVQGQGYNDNGRVSHFNGEKVYDEPLMERLSDIAVSGILCNEGSLVKDEKDQWLYSGDAIDIALLAYAYKMGFEPDDERRRYRVMSDIPFESETRYAATAYASDKETHLALKGAIETLIPMCSYMRTENGDQPIDTDLLMSQSLELAEEGYRVLAIAAKTYPEIREIDDLSEDHLNDMTILGLLGFIDPLRPEVKQAVKEANDAGVRVIMITGDHPVTAFAIAKELGIADTPEQVISGQELSEMDPDDLDTLYDRVKKTSVFARVTPHQKLQIVDIMVKMGEFVAVTGDGVNDAPALRRAHIGVAMGSGTDIAKDTSMITILDDNFASIVAGIEEGRFAYANVRKVTLLLISTGAAELVLFGSSIMMGLQVPLLAAQILWVNLVTNGIQDVALAFEAGEKNLMRLPPRDPSEGIFDKKMIEQVLLGAAVMGIICVIFWYVAHGRVDVTDEKALKTIRNELFTLLVIFQFYHVFNCRSEYVSAFRIPLKSNVLLMIGMVVAFGVHVGAMYIPVMQDVLKMQPLTFKEWLMLTMFAAPLFIALEIYKRIKHPKARVN